MKSGYLLTAVLALVVVIVHGKLTRQASGSFPRPAFSAGLTASINVSDHVNVTYDRVWTNVGNGYDPKTGIFTAPSDGTYTFIFHALAELDGMLWLDFYQNSKYIISAYAHVENQYGAASNSVTLTINKGDQLYITGHGSSILYGGDTDVYATFSGYLLFPSNTTTTA